jgi:ParB family chromosome partitioning protein
MITETTLVYLNPRDLLPSRHKVRSDPGDLAGLAETIREHGILQPLGVTREGRDYRIVYGNRRRDAAIVVGLDRVPCVVIDARDDNQVVVQQVLENLQRLDLNDLDQSRALQELLSHLTAQGLPQSAALERMARTLGLSARQMQRYLRLGSLAPAVQQMIARGEFGVTHAQHLLELAPASRQEEVAQLMVDESLSAAELSRLCAVLAHNANIDAHLALHMLRRGERVPTVEMRPTEGLPHFGPAPMAEDAPSADWPEDDGPTCPPADAGDDAPPWDAAPARDDYDHLEPTTRDGYRVLKIHSLDAFVDEVARLTRCVQDGDLQRLLGEDEGGRVKLRLAARQLRFLAEAVATIQQAAEAAGG